MGESFAYMNVWGPRLEALARALGSHETLIDVASDGARAHALFFGQHPELDLGGLSRQLDAVVWFRHSHSIGVDYEEESIWRRGRRLFAAGLDIGGAFFLEVPALDEEPIEDWGRYQRRVAQAIHLARCNVAQMLGGPGLLIPVAQDVAGSAQWCGDGSEPYSLAGRGRRMRVRMREVPLGHFLDIAGGEDPWDSWEDRAAASIAEASRDERLTREAWEAYAQDPPTWGAP